MSDRLLHGVGVSPGICCGPASIIQWELPTVTRRLISTDQVDGEFRRLQEAVAAVTALLGELRDRTIERAGAEEAKIFDAQILMLEDPEFLREVETLIRENQLSAERAFEFKTLEMRALWAQSPSARLRQRVADLTGLQLRVLNHLLGRPLEAALERDDEHPVIVFTRELTPGLMVQFERQGVAGFASEEGTRTAHAAILARSLGLPCVMGLIGCLERIKAGSKVILDGSRGTVLLDPTDEELEAARETRRHRRHLNEEIAKSDGEPVTTRDGIAVTVLGNVDLPEDLDGVALNGAEGVGLLRTEFLLLGRREMPTEDEETAFFIRAAERFSNQPVIVRSYDLGGDKYPLSLETGAEANPFLGWRAIRVCLDQPSVFRAQIRALLRARRHGDLRLMLPLVTSLEEIDRTREMVAEAVEDLKRDGIAAAGELPLGVMIETPAAALMADQIAERSDFLSVGTNDLTQYTLAVDRGNARLAGRFSPHHPAVVQFLRHIVEAGDRAGLPPSVCGEMASEPLSILLLLGLGYRVLSVGSGGLPLARWFIRQVDITVAKEVAAQVLQASTVTETEALLREALGRLVDVDVIDAGRLPVRHASATLNDPH